MSEAIGAQRCYRNRWDSLLAHFLPHFCESAKSIVVMAIWIAVTF